MTSYTVIGILVVVLGATLIATKIRRNRRKTDTCSDCKGRGVADHGYGEELECQVCKGTGRDPNFTAA